MKYFIILVVGAQALACGDRDPQPCTLFDHVEDNWLASAEESFIFLSNNWEKFVHAIPSVSRVVFLQFIKYLRLMLYCNRFSIYAIPMAIL